MKSVHLILAVVLISTALHESVMATLPSADPPMFRFVPDLEVYPQNFAITIDDQSRVFVGNSDGVLVYDGENWQVVVLNNGNIVRSLKRGDNDRVYVGGYNSFGYLEQDRTGQFRYRNLTPFFSDFIQDDLFADIWHIEISDEAVYFVGLEHLFRFEPQTEKVQGWKHEGSFGPITNLNNRVYLQFRGDGLKFYEDGDWTLIEHGPDMSRIFLSAMPVLNDEIIIISPEDKWYRFDGNEFTELTHLVDIPNKGSVTNAIGIDNQTLALSTQLGRLVYLEVESGQASVFQVSSGFLPDLTTSHTGDTLVVDDLGFYSVHWPARWQRIDRSSGLVGTIHDLRMINGTSYALTSSGVFYSDVQSGGFVKLPWTDYEAWNLLQLNDHEVLFADSYEIKLINLKTGKIEPIDDDVTARLFLRSEFDPDLVYVGTELGFQVLRMTDGRWQSIYRDDTWDNLRVTEIIELDASNLLIGSERGGVRKIDLTNLISGDVTNYKYESWDGLIYGDVNMGAYLFERTGQIYASTSIGIFELAGDKFTPTTFDGLTELYPLKDPVKVTCEGESCWAFTHNHLFKKNHQWREEEISTLSIGGISDVFLIDGQPYIGGLGSMLTFNAEAERISYERAPLTLSTASLFKAGSDRGSNLPLDEVILSSADTRLSLKFAVADFNNPDRVRYRTRLLPNEQNFSSWSENSELSFVTLVPDRYTLQIEARDSLGQVSTMEIPIVVQPQWFETQLFRIGVLAIVFALFAWLTTYINRLRSRRLKEERDRLEDMVSERTQALKVANQQLEKMAHLDGLTQIPNRRRLDSYLSDVWEQSLERQRVLGIAIIDVDHFKRYNDTHGHQAGDELLVELARVLSRNLRRAEDLVARYGGEEFLVVLPGADETNSIQVVEEMRQQVGSSTLDITVSAGVFSRIPHESGTLEAMIAKADEALYRAKHGGRNRVIHYVEN